ncbi:hypothetical protein FDB39_12490 [Clostridium botulinum]|nr:hypothetical protein [Clostridium botulinum]
MKLKFMQLGNNLVTGEDNERDTWDKIQNKFKEESKELIEAMEEGNLLHILEETFDVIQITIRSLTLLKKNNVDIELGNRVHLKKLCKRRWKCIRFIRVFWDK